MSAEDTAVFIVDDDRNDRRALRRLLNRRRPHFAIHEAATAEELRETADDLVPTAVLLDYRLPGTDGLVLLPELRARWPRSAFILMTGQGSERLASSAIKTGAADYIPKAELSEDLLIRVLESGIAAAEMSWRLAEQRRELESFADILVHDLSGPIRAAGFLTEQMSTAVRAGDVEHIGEELRMLELATGQMAALVDSLAAHIRADHPIKPNREQTDALLEIVLAGLSADIAESNAQISCESAVEHVYCGGPEVVQLLQNLVSNAIKYAGDEIPQVVIRALPTSSRGVRFEVCDRGIGIGESFHQQIFEPFSRAPTKAGINGTGLGLATCRRVAEGHAGRIWCESEVDVGTTMIFELPNPAELDAALASRHRGLGLGLV